MAEPAILLLSLDPRHWAVCRLSAALLAGGWRVMAVAPADSLLNRAGRADRKVPLARPRVAPAVHRVLEKAVVDFSPLLLLPADDLACVLVDHLMDRPEHLSPRLLDLVAHSLGDPATLYDRLLKPRTLAHARAAGVPVPMGRTAASIAEAAAFADANGYPVVLKQAWNASGNGVRRCGDRAALARAFRELSARPPPWQRVLRRLAGRDWRPPRGPIDVQAFIPGTPAMSCAVARAGRVVAVLCARTRQATRPEGRASVVTLCRHAAMEDATAAMVAAFGASGFIAFDFVIEAETGRAVLIECNPRPIQVAHLGPRIGVDLVAALAHAFADAPPPPPPGGVPREETVAFFPQEWQRDSRSPHFAAAFHDVPWDEPALVEATLGGQPPPSRTVRGVERS
jgi:hypothetical protein